MSEHSQRDPLKSYLLVFGALMVLLGLTVVVYHVPFEKIGHGQFAFMNTALALTIAIIKALLVVLIFMHLSHGTKLIWVVASAGFLWLMIMFTFTLADYNSRDLSPENMTPTPTQTRTVPPEH